MKELDAKLTELKEDRQRKQDEARTKKEAAEKEQALRAARQTATSSKRLLA